MDCISIALSQTQWTAKRFTHSLTHSSCWLAVHLLMCQSHLVFRNTFQCRCSTQTSVYQNGKTSSFFSYYIILYRMKTVLAVVALYSNSRSTPFYFILICRMWCKNVEIHTSIKHKSRIKSTVFKAWAQYLIWSCNRSSYQLIKKISVSYFLELEPNLWVFLSFVTKHFSTN